MTIQEIIEDVKKKMCDKYCKYPNEHGHEDDTNLLFRDGGPCENCPLKE